MGSLHNPLEGLGCRMERTFASHQPSSHTWEATQAPRPVLCSQRKEETPLPDDRIPWSPWSEADGSMTGTLYSCTLLISMCVAAAWLSAFTWLALRSLLMSTNKSCKNYCILAEPPQLNPAILHAQEIASMTS